MKKEKIDRRQKPERLVVDDAAGQRLDNFLVRMMKGVPRTRIYRMVRRGEVRVNGGRKKVDYRLESGDEVRIPPHRGAERTDASKSDDALALGERLRAHIVFEDEKLLVLDKPSGVAVHGGSGVSHGVIEALRALRAEPFELAHRIDRDTSGILVLAKRRPALRELHAAFRDGSVQKRYDVVVAGLWSKKVRTVTERLIRYTLPNGERRVRVSADGERARTDFEIVGVDEAKGRTWLAAFPRTGRTHQIRVHALSVDRPILGDDKYAERSARQGRLMLHASRIRFPLNGELRRFQAPLPAGFAEAGDWRS